MFRNVLCWCKVTCPISQLRCWQKWKATQWFIFTPFLHGLYSVTPNSNQNLIFLIFPHDNSSLRVNFYPSTCFSTFTMDLLVRSVNALTNKIQIRAEKLIHLCFNLFPFFHSPIFSYWPLLNLPSCSLFLFAAVTIATVEPLQGLSRAVNPPHHQIFKIDTEGMIDDVISHNIL